MLWHRDTDLQGSDLVVIPGGFSYGDHLRAGAIARFAPLMQSVADFARDGGMVLGSCNGFQILCEAHLLPGALLRNASLQFRCGPQWLRVETAATPFTRLLEAGRLLQLPISHGEGCYVAEEATLDELEREDRVVLRYVRAGGAPAGDESPNGSARDIAGIVDAGRTVFGLMPHPERACEPLLGGTDGLLILRSIVAALNRDGALVGNA